MSRNVILAAVVWAFLLQATAFAEVRIKKFADGQVRSAIEMNAVGLPHGLSREYYPNGTLKAERHYRDGRLEGVSRLFDATGRIVTEWHYRDGALQTEYTYRRGTLTRQKTFDAAGDVTRDQTFDRSTAPPP